LNASNVDSQRLGGFAVLGPLGSLADNLICYDEDSLPGGPLRQEEQAVPAEVAEDGLESVMIKAAPTLTGSFDFSNNRAIFRYEIELMLDSPDYLYPFLVGAIPNSCANFSRTFSSAFNPFETDNAIASSS